MDRLPTLGFIHRPPFISFKDTDGKLLARPDQGLQALIAGWQRTLLTRPDTERVASPARMVTAAGDDTAQNGQFATVAKK